MGRPCRGPFFYPYNQIDPGATKPQDPTVILQAKFWLGFRGLEYNYSFRYLIWGLQFPYRNYIGLSTLQNCLRWNPACQNWEDKMAYFALGLQFSFLPSNEGSK